MKESYTLLLKEHIMHALIDPKVGNLKNFMHELLEQNKEDHEKITKAYQSVNEELVGSFDE